MWKEDSSLDWYHFVYGSGVRGDLCNAGTYVIDLSPGCDMVLVSEEFRQVVYYSGNDVISHRFSVERAGSRESGKAVYNKYGG